LQQNTRRLLNDVNNLRVTADSIILSIWNEVEDYFKDLPDEERRLKASEYGVAYVYRKNEIKDFRLADRSLLKLFN